MALTFNKIKPEGGRMVTMTKRLYLTADRKSLVEEGQSGAAFLFCVPGRRISAADADRYGLTGSKDEAPTKKDAPNLEGSKDAGPDEDKAAPIPENKAKKKKKKKKKAV